jgi:hypothetical protein
MNNDNVPSIVQDRYRHSWVRGRRITRLEESTVSDFCLDAPTAWVLGLHNAGIFVGGCDPTAVEEQLKQLRHPDASAFWILVASTKVMALLLAQKLLELHKRANAAAPKKPVWRDNIVITTPEKLASIEIPDGQSVAAIVLEDMLCRVHLLRGDEPKGWNYESNDRPQHVVNFRSRLAEGMWMPPLFLLTERPAKAVETAAIARAYCLDAWWFLDGRTFSCGTICAPVSAE